MKRHALMAGVASIALALSAPAMATDAVVNTLGGSGATLSSTNNNTVGNTGTFGAITSTIDAESLESLKTYVASSGPTITNTVGARLAISSIGAAASVSAETTFTPGTDARTVSNDLLATSVTALNDTAGAVTNAGTVYGVTVTSGQGTSISIQSIGASAGMSTTTMYIPAPNVGAAP